MRGKRKGVRGVEGGNEECWRIGGKLSGERRGVSENAKRGGNMRSGRGSERGGNET